MPMPIIIHNINLSIMLKVNATATGIDANFLLTITTISREMYTVYYINLKQLDKTITDIKFVNARQCLMTCE